MLKVKHRGGEVRGEQKYHMTEIQMARRMDFKDTVQQTAGEVVAQMETGVV